MPAPRPLSESESTEVRAMLLAGNSANLTAKTLGLPRRRVHDLARELRTELAAARAAAKADDEPAPRPSLDTVGAPQPRELPLLSAPLGRPRDLTPKVEAPNVSAPAPGPLDTPRLEVRYVAPKEALQ